MPTRNAKKNITIKSVHKYCKMNNTTSKNETRKREFNHDEQSHTHVWTNDNYMCLSSDDEEDDDKSDIVVVRVERNKEGITTTSTQYVGKDTDVPLDEIQVVKVTPPKKKKVKVSKDGVPMTEVLMSNTKTTGENQEDEVTEESRNTVDYHVIKSLLCKDGSNLLTVIPGGYTEHWKCPRYINMLHRSLYYELKTWSDAIKDFVDNSDDKLRRIGLEPHFDVRQGNHVKKFVRDMERLVLRKVLKRRSVVLHSLNYEGLMHSFPGITKDMAKLVYNFCRSKSFHVRLMMMWGGGNLVYDIGTLFSAGWEWQFGQFGDRDVSS